MKQALVLLGVVFALLLGCSGGANKKHQRDAEYYYSLAVNNFYSQNSQASLQELSNCFAVNPDHVKAHNLAGLIYLGRKDYATAQSHFERAMALDASFLDARANLGVVYLSNGDWTSAIEVLMPLLSDSLYPTPYLVENNIGWAYFKMGRLHDAEQHLRRALFLNGEMCLAYNNIALVHIEQNRLEDAELELEAAIEKCPDYVEPLFHLGALLETTGHIPEAVKRFNKCVKLGKDSLFGRRCQKKVQALK